MSDNHTLKIDEILELLPHRYPFLLVDRVLDFEEGKFCLLYTSDAADERVRV